MANKTGNHRAAITVAMPPVAGQARRLAIMPFGNSHPESQRDSIIQPRVATKELPWVNPPITTNPNGVADFPYLSTILNLRKA